MSIISAASWADLLDEVQVLLVVAARRLGGDQCQRADRAAAGTERRDDRRARVEPAVEVELLAVARRLDEELLRHLRVELGAAAHEHRRGAVRIVRNDGEAPPQLARQLALCGIGVLRDDVADAAVVLDEVDPAPVAELGDGEPGQLDDHPLVVGGDGQRPRQTADEALTLDAAPARRDVARQPGDQLAAQAADTAANRALQLDPAPTLLRQRGANLDLEARLGGERVRDGGAEPRPVVRMDPREELVERIGSARAPEAVAAARVVRPAHPVALDVPLPHRHARLVERVVHLARAGRERSRPLFARDDPGDEHLAEAEHHERDDLARGNLPAIGGREEVVDERDERDRGGEQPRLEPGDARGSRDRDEVDDLSARLRVEVERERDPGRSAHGDDGCAHGQQETVRLEYAVPDRRHQDSREKCSRGRRPEPFPDPGGITRRSREFAAGCGSGGAVGLVKAKRSDLARGIAAEQRGGNAVAA